jgi:hypothetical protein
VVERAEQEHRVDRRIRLRESAGIADFGGQKPVPSCGSDMLRDEVDEMHAVAPARQPGRVYAGAAADVEHHGRSRWQLTLQQLARAKQLESVVGKPEQALPFVLPVMVGEQVLTLRHETIVDELSMASQRLYAGLHPSSLSFHADEALRAGPVNGPLNGRGERYRRGRVYRAGQTKRWLGQSDQGSTVSPCHCCFQRAALAS